MATERVRGDALRVLEPAVVDRGADGVEHQRDSRHGLDGTVVELVREPPPLVLLGGDQLLGEPRLLGEETRVLARPHREVRQHGRARDVDALERPLALQPQHAELAVVGPQGHLEPVPVRGRIRGRLARQCRVRAEEPLGLRASPLEHLVRR